MRNDYTESWIKCRHCGGEADNALDLCQKCIDDGWTDCSECGNIFQCIAGEHLCPTCEEIEERDDE